MSARQQFLAAVKAVPFCITALLVSAVCLYPLLRTGPVFNTPDETSNYLAAGEFSERGTLYLENELTAVDRENLLHTRGFITHRGRAVPMQFLGHPFFWGCAGKLLGPRAWLFVNPLLGLFFTVYLYRLFRLVAPAASPAAFFFAFAATPLIYLLGRPFLSASLATVFTIPLYYHAIHYARTGSRNQLLLCSAFLSLALFARPDNIPLALPALYLVISHAAGGVFNRAVLRDAGLFLLVFTVLFVIPVLALNQLTYGSPTTYGYQLVDQTIGLREAPAAELAGAAHLLRTVRNLILPFDVSFGAALAGLFKYFVLLTPLLTLTALAGCGGLARLLRSPGSRWRAIAALVLAGYLVLSRASGNLHGMGRLAPDILDSLARYWTPLYLILLLVGWTTLARLKRPLFQTAVALFALGLGFYGLYFQWGQSFVEMTRRVHVADLVNGKMMKNTELDAVVYSGRNDKYIVPYRYTAAWWETGSGSCYDPHLLARSAARVLDLGRPVYLAESNVDFVELGKALDEEGLALRLTRFRRNLFSIERSAPAARTHIDRVDTSAARP